MAIFKFFGKVISKPSFVLLIAVVNASASFAGVLINHYINDPILSASSAIFLSTIATALVAWLSAQEQVAPAVVAS